MQIGSFTDSNYRPCMVCDKPGKPKHVMPGTGLEVCRKEAGERVGYLHANCKDAWTAKHGGTEFTFRSF